MAYRLLTHSVDYHSTTLHVPPPPSAYQAPPSPLHIRLSNPITANSRRPAGRKPLEDGRPFVDCHFAHCETRMLQTSLKKHIKVVHLKEGQAVCHRCKNTFSRRDSLQRHFKGGCAPEKVRWFYIIEST